MAYYRSAVSAIVLVGIAVLFGRPDLLVIATPLVIVAAWSASTAPRRVPRFSDRLEHETVREGDATTWRIAVTEVEDTDIVGAVTTDMLWVERKPARGAVTAPAGETAAPLAIALRSTRWGRRFLEPIRVSAASPWGAFRMSAQLPGRTLTTLPLPAVFDSTAPVRPTDGLVGSYRSVRAGDGSEFASVRSFQVGDRMRRINWSRSLRSDGLQVNATWADQDTHIELVLDTSVDVGSSEGFEGLASSLDVSVRAAGAIAEHYVQRGDRVSLRSLEHSPRLTLPPATGQAHLRRILDTLARVNVSGERIDTMVGRRSSVMAEMVVVFSPLVAPEALDRAVALGLHGRSVVIVDTLPDHVIDDDDQRTVLAWRIRLLERRRELRRAQELGVAVVRWLGPGSLDLFLRDVARRSSAPRVKA